MIKKVLNITLYVVIVALCVTLLGFVNYTQNNKVCTAIKIEIDHSNGNYFVDEEDVFAMVYHEMDTVVGKPISTIDLAALEHKIDNHPSISKAEVFKTIYGELKIEVSQRTPIVRIFNQKGESFYIDSTGMLMPPSNKYTARVLIANGFVFDSFVDFQHNNIQSLEDSSSMRTKIDDIFRLAQYIDKHEFWGHQIEQLYVNKDYEIELIPRVGSHRIVLGDATLIEEKFNKLKIFYQKGLSKTGWNEYSSINLKFANQVVCTKR